MKPIYPFLSVVLFSSPHVWAEDEYTNFIRQYQMPSNVVWDCSDTVAPKGSQPSSLVIEEGGANFALWTIKTSPVREYLLNTCYVGGYVPRAQIEIISKDPYKLIPRTRADQPFTVNVTISELSSIAAYPAASKSVTYIQHTQAYGEGGTGSGLDRKQASVSDQRSITTNGEYTFKDLLPTVPSSILTKARGEQRFSVFTIEDNQGETYRVPEMEIASKYIQVWPVTDASIEGIKEGDKIRFHFPSITLKYNDIYPGSTVYAQVYTGDPQPGQTGTKVPGSTLTPNLNIPASRVIVLQGHDYDSAFAEDGHYTIELVIVTPFGTERMRDENSGKVIAVGVDVNRTLKVNGGMTTIE